MGKTEPVWDRDRGIDGKTPDQGRNLYRSPWLRPRQGAARDDTCLEQGPSHSCASSPLSGLSLLRLLQF